MDLRQRGLSPTPTCARFTAESIYKAAAPLTLALMARTNTFSKDIDSEMVSLLAIALDLSLPRAYPPHVVAALETAYCTHFRNFMEFMHNGRPAKPPKPKKKTAKPPKPRDIWLNHFTKNPVVVPWKPKELTRFKAADKLGAHPARGRAQRRHTKRFWGGPEDHALVLQRIKEVFRTVPKAKNTFPRTNRLFELFR